MFCEEWSTADCSESSKSLVIKKSKQSRTNEFHNLSLNLIICLQLLCISNEFFAFISVGKFKKLRILMKFKGRVNFVQFSWYFRKWYLCNINFKHSMAFLLKYKFCGSLLKFVSENISTKYFGLTFFYRLDLMVLEI